MKPTVKLIEPLTYPWMCAKNSKVQWNVHALIINACKTTLSYKPCDICYTV